MVGNRRELEDGQDHRVVSGHRAGGLRTRALHDLKLESTQGDSQGVDSNSVMSLNRPRLCCGAGAARALGRVDERCRQLQLRSARD